MGLTEDAEKAQVVLGSRYSFDATQWLTLFRQIDSPHAKAGMRCIVQAGTVFTFLLGRYRTPWGDVILEKAELRKAVAETRIHHLKDLINDEGTETFFDIRDLGHQLHVKTKMKASMLANHSAQDRVKVIVVKGNNLDVPFNPAIPGGFYRRGGHRPEEEVCRRTNLWECLQDPYGHSAKTEMGSNIFLKSSTTAKTRPTEVRSWKYPIPDTSCVYAPTIMLIRQGERDGYGFLNTPGVISCLCASPNMTNEYLDSETFRHLSALPKATSSTKRNIVWQGKYGNKALEPLMTTKSVEMYTKKVEMIFRAAIREKSRILVLDAFGCSSHATPPNHAAHVHQSVLQALDPTGKHFDLVVFAILDNDDCLCSHNPNGNVVPFSQVFCDGKVLALSDLHDIPAIDETELEAYLRTRPVSGTTD
ncbi:hypothetical protein BC830DRAFT_1184337, partial [Chytriomyces sp. MP71]